jgi:hypothetical protein
MTEHKNRTEEIKALTGEILDRIEVLVDVALAREGDSDEAMGAAISVPILLREKAARARERIHLSVMEQLGDRRLELGHRTYYVGSNSKWRVLDPKALISELVMKAPTVEDLAPCIGYFKVASTRGILGKGLFEKHFKRETSEQILRYHHEKP